MIRKYLPYAVVIGVAAMLVQQPGKAANGVNNIISGINHIFDSLAIFITSIGS